MKNVFCAISVSENHAFCQEVCTCVPRRVNCSKNILCSFIFFHTSCSKSFDLRSTCPLAVTHTVTLLRGHELLQQHLTIMIFAVNRKNESRKFNHLFQCCWPLKLGINLLCVIEKRRVDINRFIWDLISGMKRYNVV